MANVKIKDLTNLTDPSTTDVMPVVDVDADVTKKVSVGEVVGKITGDVDVATDGTSSIASGVIVDADINANAEIAVSKLADGTARQLLQTDAAGTGVEWTDDVDLPGTLDVTGVTTLDDALNVAGLASLDGGIDVDGAFTVANTSGNVATSGTLDVTGATTLDSTLNVDGQSTLSSAAVSDLTEDRVVIAGASGELEDSANFTFDGSELGITGTLDVSSNATVGGNLTVTGDLTVEGATTTLETQTVTVEDKNIELGVVGTPTDTTANGGGITLKGATDKTINWVDATDAWTFSEHIELASAKEFYIDGNGVLNATTLGSGVVNSSLTSVGTIATGTWQGTTIATGYGGTGIAGSYTNGELLIGKTDGTLAKATLTAGNGIDITNADGGVTVDVDLKANGGLVLESTELAVDLNASAITGTLGVADGGTGQTTYTDGQLLIGNTTGNTLSKATLTAGTGISVTNGNGSIAVAIDSSVVTTSDTGTVTSTMILDGTIVNDDINASAAIADTKLDTISTAGKVSNSATTATDANTANAIVARDASGDFAAGTITADLTGNADTATALNSSRTFAVTGDVTGTVSSDLTSGASIATSIASGVIVDADVNASAAIAGTKIDPDFGSQTVETTGVFSAAGGAEATPSITFTGDLNTGIYSPGADQVAISTSGVQRINIEADGDINIDSGGVFYDATNRRLLVGTSSAFNVRIATTAVTLQQQLAGNTGTGASFVQGCASTTDTAAAFHWFAKFASGTVNDNTTTVVSGEQLGTITWSGSDGTNQTQAAHIRCEVDGTPGANDMPGRLVFSVTADGASSPTEALRISNDRYVRLASGSGGIQFNGDTAAANALDDYEEGTWTPSLVFLTSGSVTLAEANGYYTKIGRQVFVHCIIRVATLSSPTGDAVIEGLPFAANSAGTFPQYMNIGNTTNAHDIVGNINPDSTLSANQTTTINLFKDVEQATRLTDADIVGGGGGTAIRISMSYTT